ncbi:MAG: hypothetical protein V1729_02000 [Candidatus Woesearchaeota archaeon]
MEDDDLLFELRDTNKRSRSSFESVINRKEMSGDDLDMMMNYLN